MSYTPTNWATGDVITAAKLNKLEQGIANAGGSGSVVVVDIEVANTEGGTTVTVDKTFAELKTAHEGGAIMLCNIDIQDNVSSLYGNTLSFMLYHPERQFPLPTPEKFIFEASYIDANGASQCCSVSGSIDENDASATIYVQSLQ